MRNPMPLSDFVLALYKRVPEHAREHILKPKKNLSLSKSSVRLQPYLRKELYVVLAHYGALDVSETAYFTRLAEKDIEATLVQSHTTRRMLQEDAAVHHVLSKKGGH